MSTRGRREHTVIKGVNWAKGSQMRANPACEVHDPLVLRREGERRWIARDTNRVAGLEGVYDHRPPHRYQSCDEAHSHPDHSTPLSGY